MNTFSGRVKLHSNIKQQVKIILVNINQYNYKYPKQLSKKSASGIDVLFPYLLSNKSIII